MMVLVLTVSAPVTGNKEGIGDRKRKTCNGKVCGGISYIGWTHR
jgi:hypothetical protein